MAKDINWGYVFGGVSVVVGLVALYKMNGSASNASPVQNIFPALNEQAMAGPSVPGYNVPTLSLSNGQTPQNNGGSPDYMNNNQMNNRKRKLHNKWANWRNQNKKSCCNPCNNQSTSVIQNADSNDILNGLYNLNGTTDPEQVEGSSYSY